MRPQFHPVNRIITASGCRSPPATARPVGIPPTGRAFFILQCPAFLSPGPCPAAVKCVILKSQKRKGHRHGAPPTVPPLKRLLGLLFSAGRRLEPLPLPPWYAGLARYSFPLWRLLC